MTDRIEVEILSNLITNEEYSRKVLPYLSDEYFSVRSDKIVFNEIKDLIETYNKIPTQKILKIQLDEKKGLSEVDYKESLSLIEELYNKNENVEWLIDSTEKFCKKKSLYNAMMESISIMDDEKSAMSVEGIPSMIQEALSVSFDNSIGHDFTEDVEARYEVYHRKEEKIPFDIDILNKITKGGLSKKTLNVLLMGTNVGKSLMMCHCAASCLRMGYNALYITMEMAEERIAERIDCNLLDVDLDTLYRMKKNDYLTRMEDLQTKSFGKLIIKEYPTSNANAGHFRVLLEDLAIKKKFIPDIIFIDYINICSSTRYKGGNVNSYTLVKGIAEELRGLAVEYNLPILSATQTNRSGWSNSDIGMEDTSECIYSEELVEIYNGGIRKISELKPGDQIVTNDKFKTVRMVHHPKLKECFKITLKSGKEITVSKDHVFPTNDGRLCISDGLNVGHKLNSK